MGTLFFVDGVEGDRSVAITYASNGGGLKYGEYYYENSTLMRLVLTTYSGTTQHKAAFYYASPESIQCIMESGVYGYVFCYRRSPTDSWQSYTSGTYIVRTSMDIDGVTYGYAHFHYSMALTPTLSSGVNTSAGNPAFPTNYSLNDVYGSLQEAVLAINGASPIVYPITYQNVNCELSGPTEAAVGSDVSVIVTHGDNFTVSTSDIYVTNNGVSVPFTFANGIVTFTMPDPDTST